MQLRHWFVTGCLILFFSSCTHGDVQDLRQDEALQIIADPVLQEKAMDLINSMREADGSLPLLQFHEKVYEYSYEQSVYMATYGKLSHDGFTERAQMLSEQTGAVLVAENISRNFESPEATVENWMNSPGHKANILGDFTHSAVAVVRTAGSEVYYTQIFIKIPTP